MLRQFYLVLLLLGEAAVGGQVRRWEGGKVAWWQGGTALIGGGVGPQGGSA